MKKIDLDTASDLFMSPKLGITFKSRHYELPDHSSTQSCFLMHHLLLLMETTSERITRRLWESQQSLYNCTNFKLFCPTGNYLSQLQREESVHSVIL